MNSSSAELQSGIESDLLDLAGVPFTALRDLDGEPLRRSLGHVVERTRLVHARYRSGGTNAGERID